MKTFILFLFTISTMYSSSLQIVGEFEGWDDEVIVQLTDGTCWKQAYYFYYYYYFNYPTVKLYKKNGLTYLKVDGCPEMQVYQLNCNDNSKND